MVMADKLGKRIQVKNVAPKESNNQSLDDLVGLVCYFYPQYNYSTASNLPLKRISALLKIARQQEAVKYKNLTQIVAAPHSKKGIGVNKLLKHYDKIIKTG